MWERISIFREVSDLPDWRFSLEHAKGNVEGRSQSSNYSKKGSVGRPRQIDFCLYEGSPEIAAAFEVKWVSSKGLNWQSIVDDIFRLEALRYDGKYVYRYFVIARKTSNFNKQFLQHENFGEFFNANRSKNVKFYKLPEKQNKLCIMYGNKYRRDFPLSFSVKCLYKKTLERISLGLVFGKYVERKIE